MALVQVQLPTTLQKSNNVGSNVDAQGCKAVIMPTQPPFWKQSIQKQKLPTHHKVPSTSKTTPFNFGTPSTSLSTPSFSGANRLGSFDLEVVMVNDLRIGLCETKKDEGGDPIEQSLGILRKVFINGIGFEIEMGVTCDSTARLKVE